MAAPPGPSVRGRPGRRLALAALSIVCLACGSPNRQGGGEPGGAPSPETRFGNDRAVVARFAELEACALVQGRLDHSCPQLQRLRQDLAQRRADPERRDRLVRTLRNLLESRSEVTRLVAAESLFPEHRRSEVRRALQAALDRERSAAVRAALLRQLCWEPGAEALRSAARLLGPGSPVPVRVEAASCLGRSRQAAPELVSALRAALREKAAPELRVALCAALGRLNAQAAVPELARQLTVADADWRCATALAALGTEPAYRALLEGAGSRLRGGRLSPQLVTALLAFSGKPFFERAAVLELLSRIAAERRLSWVTRQRAVLELAELGGRAELRALRATYRKATAEADRLVAEEVERGLPR